MAEKRMVAKAIFTDSDIIELSLQARWLFLGLILTADDDGRGRASAKGLKMAVFPAETLTAEEVQTMMDEIAALGLITIYQGDDNRPYYVLRSWFSTQYLRKDRYKPSTHPVPPQGAQKPPSADWLDHAGLSLGKDGRPQRRKRSRSTRRSTSGSTTTATDGRIERREKKREKRAPAGLRPQAGTPAGGKSSMDDVSDKDNASDGVGVPKLVSKRWEGETPYELWQEGHPGYGLMAKGLGPDASEEDFVKVVAEALKLPGLLPGESLPDYDKRCPPDSPARLH